MTFAELSGYLDRLEGTRSRKELVKTLAEMYAAASAAEIQPLTYLIQGRLAPFFEPIEVGMGEKLVMAAIAQSAGRPVEEIAKLYDTRADLGLVAADVSTTSAGVKAPAVTDVHARLLEISAAAGVGSVEKKRSGFASLLQQLDAAAAKHLVRIALGRLRLGIGDPTVLEALSFTKQGDKSMRPVLEAA